VNRTDPTMLAATDERPLAQRPDVSNWSENYCLPAYDPACGFGVWLHVGLPVDDFDVWHDITVVYLPGGREVLVAQGFGQRGGTSDICGSMLRGDYDDATGEWVMRFRGAGQRWDPQALATGPATGAAVEPLAFELRYHGLAEVWNLQRQVAGQTWGNAHWEQPCTVRGWVEVGTERTPFNGTGMRDHSRGARDFSAMGQHYWLHGQMPSGRAFGVLHIDATTTQPRVLSTAYLVADGHLAEAEIVSLPGDRSFAAPFEVVVAGPDGEERIRGELVHDMAITIRYPNEIRFGCRPGQPQHLVREGQVRWQWGDEVGYGIGERSVTMAADGAPERR
jgi:hypothetical protein